MAKPQDFCHYHSTAPAVWYCDECPRHFCADCVVPVDTGPRAADPRCVLCQNPLTFLGASNTAAPFWGKAHVFFLYPLSLSGLVLIVATALSVTLLGFTLFGLLAWLGFYILAIRYGFVVLQHIMLGEQQAPDLSLALEGDEDHLFLRYVGMMIVLIFIQLAAQELIGNVSGLMVGVVITLISPAAIVFLAVEKRVLSALNPLRLIWLMTSIGWPYLLVVVISTILSNGPDLMTSYMVDFLSSSWGWPLYAGFHIYFTIVQFAMLGYVIYENQGALGFIADAEGGNQVSDTPENRRKQLFADAGILMREGKAEEALKRFAANATDFQMDSSFHERYLQLLQQAGRDDLLPRPANAYLGLLAAKDAMVAAMDVWRRARSVDPKFVPADPRLSHQLAEAAWAAGKDKDALSLLINMHKWAPQYAQLGAAYRLAARIFREGGHEEKALQLEQFLAAKGLG